MTSQTEQQTVSFYHKKAKNWQNKQLQNWKIVLRLVCISFRFSEVEGGGDAGFS